MTKAANGSPLPVAADFRAQGVSWGRADLLERLCYVLSVRGPSDRATIRREIGCCEETLRRILVHPAAKRLLCSSLPYHAKRLLWLNADALAAMPKAEAADWQPVLTPAAIEFERRGLSPFRANLAATILCVLGREGPMERDVLTRRIGRKSRGERPFDQTLKRLVAWGFVRVQKRSTIGVRAINGTKMRCHINQSDMISLLSAAAVS